MKGIILAGGTGSRLYPVTTVVSKQLLPVFDKPMIYYPLSTLMLGGIREILIISTPQDRPSVSSAARRRQRNRHALFLCRRRKPRAGWRTPSSLAATLSARTLVALVLGDNIFYGHGLPELLSAASPARRAPRCSVMSSTPRSIWGR